MLKFPNSNVFFLHFTVMIYCVSLIWSSILGDQVMCDNNIKLASYKNSLCVISMILTVYGLLSTMAWGLCYQLTIALRLANIRVASYWFLKWFYFLFSYCGYSLLVVILALALKLSLYPPGYSGCVPFSAYPFYFNWLAIFPCIVLWILCFLLLTLYSSIKLLRLRKRTHTKWRVMFVKQARLFAFWTYGAVLGLYFLLSYFGAIFKSNDLNFTLRDKTDAFIDCVNALTPEQQWEDYCPYDLSLAPYPQMLAYHVIFTAFPTVYFFMIGFRFSLLKFWKEYILYMWTTKTLVLQFHLKVDSTYTQSADEVPEETLEQVREL